MAGELVLVTGGTGSLGYATILCALKAGYRVRTTVRNQKSVESIKAAPSVQIFLKNLEFAIVEDIVKGGAYDKALQNVVYVLHIASPLPGQTGDFEANTIQPAIGGTIGILESAMKVPSIKRVVITSSIGVIIPRDESKVVNETDIVAKSEATGPYPHSFAAYRASKILAFHATKDFLSSKTPSFTVINIMPAFLIGKHELQTTPDIISTRSSSNGLLLSNLLGDTSPSPLPATFVHLDDAAMVHVLALNPAVQGNQDFVANSGGLDGGAVWDDALYIARKHFPEAVAKGILPLGGSTPAQILRVDGSRAEKVFGFKYRDFEAQVVSLVGHYVDVAEKTAAKGVANGTMDGLVNGSSR